MITFTIRRMSLIAVLLLFSQAFIACLPGTSGQQYSPEARQRPSFIRDVIVHQQFSEDVALDEVPSGVQGTEGIGFVRTEHRTIPPFERPQTREFQLTQTEPFAPYLILFNNSPNSQVFLVTIMLDYCQTPFELDGKEGLLHEVTVPSHTELEIPLRLNIDTPGTHDLQVIAFKDPYNLTLDPDYRSNLHGRVLARRTMIIIGATEKNARTLERLDIGTPPPAEVTFGLHVAFAKTSAPDTLHPSDRQLYVDQAHRGQVYTFQIWVSNYDKEQAADYAMIPFLNFHQISLMDKEVLVVHLEEGEEAIIDAEVTLPDERGVHQLQFVWLYDPYESILHDEVYAPFVFGSPRVAIETD